MNEKPIERLNYYNGQRLEASDLKLEQEYHVRVRRWLNKSLFSAGIAEGLEVRQDPGNPQRIIVSPGLALDAEGREIILLEEQVVDVVGKPSAREGEVDGNYLTIQYREETLAEESDSCKPRGNGKQRSQVAWGGPSRVRANPILSWSDVFPHESSGKIVLAQVELDEGCKVRHVYTYPRRYIGPASAAAVRQYALEGERHINKDNPGRIYFHIRGRQPNAVTLYLRAEQFSTLYYTEMGKHDHDITVNVNSATIPAHNHTLTLDPNTNPPTRGATGSAGDHGHNTDVRALANGAITEPFRYSFTPVWDPITQRGVSLEHWFNMTIGLVNNGNHFHAIPNSTDSDPAKTIALSGSGSSNPAGVSDLEARNDSAAHSEETLKYLSHLQVFICKADPTGVVRQLTSEDNFTDGILTQLKNAQPTVDWTDGQGNDALGNGQAGHALVKHGTGPIRLDLLSNRLSFPEGEYYIELQVNSGGGGILYNLYVE